MFRSKELRAQRSGFSDTNAGVQHGGEQHVMALVGRGASR